MTVLSSPEVAGALIVGLVVGFILGFIFAKRSKRPENQITAIQLLAIVSVFLYIGLSFGFNEEPDGFIALGILSIGYGAKAGSVLEKILESRK